MPTEASIAWSPKPYAIAFRGERHTSAAAKQSPPATADVAGPEREERRHIHQQQHEPSRGQRRVDVEGPHRRVDREELAEPTEALEERGHRRRGRRVQHAETVPAHLHQPADRAEPLHHRLVPVPRAREGECEQCEADRHHDNEARDRPVRDPAAAHTDQPHHRTRSKSLWEDRADEHCPYPASRRPWSRNFRVSTATRARSPIGPGRTAFANSPRENAENTNG